MYVITYTDLNKYDYSQETFKEYCGFDLLGSVEKIMRREDGEGGAVHHGILLPTSSSRRHLVHVVGHVTSIIAPSLSVLKAHAPRGHVVRPGHHCGRHCDVTTGVTIVINPN